MLNYTPVSVGDKRYLVRIGNERGGMEVETAPKRVRTCRQWKHARQGRRNGDAGDCRVNAAAVECNAE